MVGDSRVHNLERKSQYLENAVAGLEAKLQSLSIIVTGAGKQGIKNSKESKIWKVLSTIFPISKAFSGETSLAGAVADNVAVIGLREAVTWNHRSLKIIWVILILLGAVGTIHYMYTNTNEYLNKEVATKVKIDPKSLYKMV